jgi:ribonuclease HI
MITTSLPHEDDGIQQILATIITSHTSDDEIVKTLYILWYLWKARNDKRFSNKNWTYWQVHNAANADYQTFVTVLQDETQKNNIVPRAYHNAGNTQVPTQPENLEANINLAAAILNNNNSSVTLTIEQPQPPLYRISMPNLLQGLKIYTDASIAPDTNPATNRIAGLGVFFINPGIHQNLNVYVKATLRSVSSVFTAEVAALALAGTIVRRINYQEATFLSDSQQLVTFINSNNEDQLPRWDAKFYTQTFKNAMEGGAYSHIEFSRLIGV